MAGNFPDRFGQHQVTGTGAELGGLVAVSAVEVRQRTKGIFAQLSVSAVLNVAVLPTNSFKSP